jgi:hypothetical protein
LEFLEAARSALLKLVSGGARATEVNGGVVEQRLDPLQRCVAAALLAHYILQELAKHLVDGGPALGRHGPSRLAMTAR